MNNVDYDGLCDIKGRDSTVLGFYFEDDAGPQAGESPSVDQGGYTG